MEDKTILDSQITASSESNYQSAAQFARLHVQKTSFTTGSWLGLDHVEPWLQVDFVKYAKITAIETQGNAGEPKYTKTYTVFYSNDEENFRAYEEFGVKKVQIYFQFN